MQGGDPQDHRLAKPRLERGAAQRVGEVRRRLSERPVDQQEPPGQLGGERSYCAFAATTFRINRWAPGHSIFPHRTETLDYDIVLEGEIDLELEGGEIVHLKTGDVVIMRGCTHTWVNRSNRPAVTAFMLIDALPVATALGLLRTDFNPLLKADE